MEDFAALRFIATSSPPLGVRLDLVADPDDPRDLFGMIARAAARAAA